MKRLLFLPALFFALLSCSEDKVTIQDNQEILTSGTWKKTAVTFDKVVNVDVSGPDVEKAYINDVVDCLLDEVFSFESNFDLVINNPAACDMNENSNFNCNWSKLNFSTFAFDSHCGGYESPYTYIRVVNDTMAYLYMEQIFYEYPHDSLTLEYEWTLIKE